MKSSQKINHTKHNHQRNGLNVNELNFSVCIIKRKIKFWMRCLPHSRDDATVKGTQMIIATEQSKNKHRNCVGRIVASEIERSKLKMETICSIPSIHRHSFIIISSKHISFLFNHLFVEWFKRFGAYVRQSGQRACAHAHSARRDRICANRPDIET